MKDRAIVIVAARELRALCTCLEHVVNLLSEKYSLASQNDFEMNRNKVALGRLTFSAPIDRIGSLDISLNICSPAEAWVVNSDLKLHLVVVEK